MKIVCKQVLKSREIGEQPWGQFVYNVIVERPEIFKINYSNEMCVIHVLPLSAKLSMTLHAQTDSVDLWCFWMLLAVLKWSGCCWTTCIWNTRWKSLCMGDSIEDDKTAHKQIYHACEICEHILRQRLELIVVKLPESRWNKADALAQYFKLDQTTNEKR